MLRAQSHYAVTLTSVSLTIPKALSLRHYFQWYGNWGP